MKKLFKVAVMVCVTVVLSVGAWPVTANAVIRAGDLRELTIVNHYYTSQIMGKRAGNGYNVYVKNTSAARYLVLILKAKASKGEFILWANDFVLRYNKENVSLRSFCRGITTVGSHGTTDVFSISAKGYYAYKVFDAKHISFALAFYLENDVKDVYLERIGTKSFVYCRLKKRSYSVYMVTNVISGKRLRETKNLLEAGGYRLIFSDKLGKSNKKLSIRYMPKAEGAAREISQRLMTRFGVTSRLIPMDVLSHYDIVIWIGSDVFGKSI